MLFLRLGDWLLLLLVDHGVAKLEDDAAGLLGEEQALAELATLVVLSEERTDLAEGLDAVKDIIEHGVGLALVHVGHHHLHWLSHVNVLLNLGVNQRGLALVVLELLLAREEHAGLGAAEELSVESRGCGGQNCDSSECLHFVLLLVSCSVVRSLFNFL